MGSRYARLIWAAPLMAAVAATLTASGPPAADGPAVRSVSGRLDGEVSTVLIDTSEPVAYLTSQPDPLTVFVDLRNARAGQLDGRELGAMEPPVSNVRLESAMAPDGSPVARVRVALAHPASHRVRSSRNLIYVEVDRDGVKAATPAVPFLLRTPAAAQPETAQEVTGREPQDTARRLATRLTGVKPMALPDGTAIALSGNGRLVASRVEAVEDLPARVLLDFEGVGPGGVPPATLVDQGDVRRVRVGVNSTEPLITRVVIDLVKKLPYTVESVGEELRVLFARAAGAAASIVTPAAPEPLPVAAAPAMAPAASGTASLAAAQAAAPAVQAGQPAASEAAPPRFTGHPVTFDFQGADLRAVLRTFAEISGLNVVIDPSIQGSVDVSLKEVPWDQALDIILKANKLGYAVDGTIVRIAPLSVLAQENEERRKLAEAEALAGSLEVMTRPLSYAKAADLVPIITKSALSSRGDVQIDQRTNTLIIRDLPERLVAAGELVTSLDSPQPQVEIEARIVQTSRDFARSLGVQWGFRGRMDPALGNTTNLAFPNSASVVGETKLPVPSGVTSALGIALGSINGALNLDVALSALERTGKGRLLSTPRVSTQNNVEAEITQGVQIPIQTQANNTITVTFKDAALQLRVTPQITAAGTVIMRIAIENAAPDYSRSVNGIPPIDTQRAVTSVLVSDGETTVIGGIYTSREQMVEGRTPLLNRIPLLGWLFKRDELSEENRELLIFITPRITKG
ncbi:MAG: type IV pilus secretin PilQ [Acidobacteria bacterium]|nr:type IV pilus secretin PilQ [Acidobacteriota bacterium]